MINPNLILCLAHEGAEQTPEPETAPVTPAPHIDDPLSIPQMLRQLNDALEAMRPLCTDDASREMLRQLERRNIELELEAKKSLANPQSAPTKPKFGLC